jgi:hypothetical protein
MGWSFDLTGEAVVVEVAQGRYLFALLKGAGTTEYMGSVAAASISGRERRMIDAALFAEVQGKRGRAAGVIAVPEAQYPMLVTFGDIADQASVRLVDPDDLAATFGPEVRLKAVTLEVMDEAVTEGTVDGVLGWLGPYPEPALGPATGRADNIPFYRQVHLGDFIRRHRLDASVVRCSAPYDVAPMCAPVSEERSGTRARSGWRRARTLMTSAVRGP